MSLSALEAYETVVPTATESESARQCGRVLSSFIRRDGSTPVCVEGREEPIDIPASAMRLLVYLLGQMAEGNAITLIPSHAELTTNEAANLLGVSRPYLISLLESGKLPFRKLGTHRRVAAQDVIAFKRREKIAREKVLDALVAEAQEFGMGY